MNIYGVINYISRLLWIIIIVIDIIFCINVKNKKIKSCSKYIIINIVIMIIGIVLSTIAGIGLNTGIEQNSMGIEYSTSSFEAALIGFAPALVWNGIIFIVFVVAIKSIVNNNKELEVNNEKKN